MAKRKAISTRTRFEIFKRDGFRCVYCGVTPMKALLHVDHVKSKADGGSDEPSNLVTSCRDCNLGKSSVPLEKRKFKAKASQEDREHLDQLKEYLAYQQAMHEAKADIQETALLHWQDRVGDITKQLPSIVAGAVGEFGLGEVIEAIDIVGRKGDLRRPVDQVRYLCGIFRRKRSLEEFSPPNNQQGVIADAVREAQWKLAEHMIHEYWSHRTHGSVFGKPIKATLEKAMRAKMSWQDVFHAIDTVKWYEKDAEEKISEAIDRFIDSGVPDHSTYVVTSEEHEEAIREAASDVFRSAWTTITAGRYADYSSGEIERFFNETYALGYGGSIAIGALVKVGSLLGDKSQIDQRRTLLSYVVNDDHDLRKHNEDEFDNWTKELG